MRKDLEQCGKALYDRGFPWGTVTNGYLLNPSRLKALLDSGMRSMTISLDGLEKSHTQLRGNNKSYNKALEAIQLLSSVENFTYDIVTCVSDLNFEELEQLKNLLIEKGVKEWRISTIFPVGRAMQYNELQLSPTKFKALLEFIASTRKENRIKLNYACEGFLGSIGKVGGLLF